MAINYLSSINLNKNELRNAAIHVLATPPSSPVTGQVYFDSTDEKIYVWDGTDWQPVGDVHTIESNSINLNGTVSASTPGGSANPPLIDVHESDDGANTGGDGAHDHGIIDLRILETDGVFEDIPANGDKGEFLVRSKHIFDYVKEYVTISGTTNEIDVFSDDSALANNGLNPGITENSTIKIGLPADVVIQNNAGVNAPGETNTDGEASLIVKGTTELGRNGSASADLVNIYGDTTLGTSINNVDLTVNGNTILGVAGTSNTLQINGNTEIGDASNAKNLKVWGNLTVEGTTTTVNSETVTIADNIILLNSNEEGEPSENAGIEVERGLSTNVQLRWNESTEKWQLTEDGTNYENIITGKDQYIASFGDGVANSFTITHNLGTKDVMVQVYEVSSGDTIMLDVTRPTVNTVTLTVANLPSNIPSSNGLRVLIQKLY